MCDNLDVEGKERCGLEGQGLNTGSESCEPARDSWSPTYAPPRERDHVVLHVLRTDQVFAKDRKIELFPPEKLKNAIKSKNQSVSTLSDLSIPIR